MAQLAPVEQPTLTAHPAPVAFQAAQPSFQVNDWPCNAIARRATLDAVCKRDTTASVHLAPQQEGSDTEELFNYQHNGLLRSAQEWVKETAQSCSTVAVLVSTVVFAAAYAIPGGTSDQSGLPLFRDDPLFLFFTCMDVVGIACSLSSVAFFLSVLSSPLEYPYFVNSVPRKIMTGFILLFLSMASTMLAFAATILLLIRVEKKWTKSVLYPIAFFPVPLFGLLQFPMYQSFIVMFRKIDDWIFSPLRCPLGLSKRRSIWGKRKAY
nr:uncharacterized protein LOC103449025 [Malus domestica]